MTSAQRYRINTPDVVHEIIEGEAVIVNLGSGVYYSVDRAGADIWALIENKMPISTIVATLSNSFAGDDATIATGVERFIAELQVENLIVSDDEQEGGAITAVPSPPNADAFKPAFEPPTLQRYTDMEDLLLLDPIHDLEPDGD